MCYSSPGPRCANHTRTLYRETQQGLIEANANFEQAKQELSDANDTQAEAQLIRSEKLLKLAQANHAEASKNYEDSKADRATKMEAYREARDAYLETAEGIQSLRDAGKTDDAEKYATVRAMKLAEYKRVEAAKADIANGAIKVVMEALVVKEAVKAEPSVKSLPVWERQDIVLNSKVDAETLHQFVDDDDEIIRKSVAMNWNTTEASLLRLANDTPSIVASVVTNGNATYPVLKQTVKNANRQIRLDTVNHPAWKAEAKVAEEHESVKGLSAQEADLEVWNATPERLDQLSTSTVPGIAYRVAEHRNVLPKTLERLVFSPLTMVRNAAVENAAWPTN